MLGSELAQRLTIAEAHGELWALLVQHQDGQLELHKTETFKTLLGPGNLDLWHELEEGLIVIWPDPVAYGASPEAEVELLTACSHCQRLYSA